MFLAPLLLSATLIGNWTSHGPHGGKMNAVVSADSQVLYAGNTGGMFRSDDGGHTWRDASGVAPERVHNVTVLAVDRRDPLTVYAAKQLQEFEGEVWKSSDGGAHWTRLELPRPLIPRSIAISPGDPNTVYVASDCQLYAAKTPRAEFHEAAGIFRSTDGGATWETVPGTPSCVESLTIDPVTDPTLSSHLFVRTDFNGLHESLDGGATWRPATASVPAEGIVADPSDASLRYGIVTLTGPLFLVSTDSGVTWTTRTISGVQGRVYTFLTVDASTGRLFLGTDEGVFRSGDRGHTWLKISALPQTYASAAVVNPATRELIAATGLGLWISPFMYGTAAALPVRDAGTNVVRVLRDPGDPLRIFALTEDVFSGFGWTGGVFRSTDGGVSWELVPRETTEALSRGAVDAAGDLYAATRGRSTLYRLRRGGNVFESLPREFQDISDVYADPVRPAGVYVFDLFGSYRMLGGGMAWDTFGLPSGSMMDIHPVNPNVIVGVAYDRVYRTGDGGYDWAVAEITGQRPNPIALAPSNTSIVYLALERTDPGNPSHILGRSTDGGRTWEQRTAPPPSTRTRFIALAVDPEDANRVWAATNAGVFVSPDGGATWVDANTNLPRPTVIHSLTIDPVRGVVHLGTDHGVWSLGAGGRRRAVR